VRTNLAFISSTNVREIFILLRFKMPSGVIPHISYTSKFFPTKFAAIRSLSTMVSHVNLEITFFKKRFMTDRA